ncbi:arsenate reductase family protein [uncultured Muriicola sp.]|uniref:arsenate reductase family protein n=1 Tax=uncultured Muriicola sp. TaxID=1583102 RepID=UPI0026030F37|nr:ArsC/Spx/MgsR family protein [uncultured Muriicola sp.]
MKDTIYYLSSCDTCKRILKELAPAKEIALQDIKSSPLTIIQLDELKAKAGSYEALFSKRARLYKERNLKEKILSEADYRSMLLEHYTFLKRPVMVLGDEIFIGNTKNVVAAAKEKLHP